MIVIGILGRAGSGKDPAALVAAAFAPAAAAIVPLATGLKHMLAGYYGWSPSDPRLHTQAGKAGPSPRPMRPDNTVRDDMVMLGDATRGIQADIWVRDALSRAEDLGVDVVVFSDVRRRNECAACHHTFWIGPDTKGAHSTEAELTSADVAPEHRFMQESVHDRLEALRSYLFHARPQDRWL